MIVSRQFMRNTAVLGLKFYGSVSLCPCWDVYRQVRMAAYLSGQVYLSSITDEILILDS